MKSFKGFVAFMYAVVIGALLVMFGIGSLITEYTFIELISMSWNSGELIIGLIGTFLHSVILWIILLKEKA